MSRIKQIQTDLSVKIRSIRVIRVPIELNRITTVQEWDATEAQ